MTKSRKSWLAPLSGAALCLSGFAAGAAEKGLWEREKLTGDWGGARSALENRGVVVGLDYIGETLSVLRGGLRRATSYEGRLDGQINTDLEKLMGWAGGKTHVRAFQIHKARHNAADLVGSIADPSNIDAVSTTRLFTAWFQQDFGKFASIRVGQLAADDEFLTSTTAGGLINGTFGWATMLASNLPSGGAAYPLATPGARLQVNLTESFSLLAGAFSGDPAGKRCYDDNPDANPQICNKHGTTFSFSGGTFWIGEAQYQVNQEKDATGLAAAYKIGAWRHTGNKFADQRFGDDGTGQHPRFAFDRSALAVQSSRQLGPLRRHRPDAVARKRPERQRVRARGRLALRPQSGFALYRRRRRHQGIVCKPSGRHAHARRRAFEDQQGRGRARQRHPGAERTALPDPQCRDGVRGELHHAACAMVDAATGLSVHREAGRQCPASG